MTLEQGGGLYTEAESRPSVGLGGAQSREPVRTDRNSPRSRTRSPIIHAGPFRGGTQRFHPSALGRPRIAVRWTMPDPCHCKHCGRYVPEADPESDAVVCCYCAMGRAASPEVEKETKRQEIEWLHAQKSRAATSRARRVSRELRVMEEVES